MAAHKETGEVLPVSTAEVLAAMKNMGMNKARVESFSDGVFAFAITLLVLGIQVPDLKSVDDRQLRERLLQAMQQLLPYVTSFATIGIIWLNHHAMFDEVEVSITRFCFSTSCSFLSSLSYHFQQRCFPDMEHCLRARSSTGLC